MMSQKVDFTHQAEMGFTHRELLKNLPAAVAPFKMTVPTISESRGDLICELTNGARRVVITLRPEQLRPLAALMLPVTAVKLEFFNFNQREFDDFLTRYQRHLHKGGG